MFWPAISGGRRSISSGAVASLTILLCLGAAAVLAAARPAPDEPRLAAAANGTCQSRVEPFGYKCEEHTVTTVDGYILSLQRIPGGRGGSGQSSAGNKIPVLLQHGLLMDGVTWLMNSPAESLGYILADGGYDVWIANSRGTVYSRGHTTLSSTDTAYWDWSWDELASNDLSAVAQYVYAQSGQQRMHYVGHSLGTLIASAALSDSEQQQLGTMLRSAALLSPIAYLDKVSSPLARAAADIFLGEALYWLGLDEFDPTGEAVHKLVTDVCSMPGINCYNLMSVFTGDNCCLDNSSVQVFLAHEPQASATKNMVHLAQMIRRGTIAKYDYGNAADNREHYGQATPPAYDVSAIPDDFPLFLSYGGRDSLSDAQDVGHLVQALKSHDADKLTVQYLDDYAHADFVMAGNARERVYAPLMAFFKLQEK
ncbi:Triacylglycerol lipase 2 [Dichanthelium oligosanthes]|uniref:Lipase n=1 Tax=Dichanthelium oligosanthes TaxID=888268 RepID=A0A1E5V562_9POAL|nr:Triacylglycerol lipase 2 [Dichanthelium oligosanthes]